MKLKQSAKNAIFLGTLCSVAYFGVYIARNILGAVTPKMIENGFSEDFIGSLSEIEFLKNNLIEVIEINKLSELYKEKMHECIINILSLKRYLLSDDKYITSKMQEFSCFFVK